MGEGNFNHRFHSLHRLGNGVGVLARDDLLRKVHLLTNFVLQKDVVQKALSYDVRPRQSLFRGQIVTRPNPNPIS
ncbi:MAG: hypothetical protein QOI53_2488 [Verrucomicrobiota bacterium]|jgi:hypothetical protein|nr:hypothetical protein [Verrucomicrobiota bacterium]